MWGKNDWMGATLEPDNNYLSTLNRIAKFLLTSQPITGSLVII